MTGGTQKADQDKVGGDATQNQVSDSASQVNIHITVNILAGEEYRAVAKRTIEQIGMSDAGVQAEILNIRKIVDAVRDWDAGDGGVFTILKNKEGAAATVEELSFSEIEKRELDKCSFLFSAFSLMAVTEKREDIYGTMLLKAIRIKCLEDELDRMPDEAPEIAGKIENIVRQRLRTEESLGSTYTKIYNMLRSDDLISAVFGIWARLCEEKKKPELAIGDFSRIWRSRLALHPNKVFVGFYPLKEEIISQMRDRLVMEKNVVELFSRGEPRNGVAREAVLELMDEFPTYKVELVKYPIAKVPAAKHIFLFLRFMETG